MSRDRRNMYGLTAVTVFLMGGMVAGGVAFANPTAPQVVNGQASFATAGNTLTVTNSPGAIINWQSFSNRADELTRFVQQSSTSSVLNRVVGVDPSTILGALQSNGRVFLINPKGILFGPGARIDVNGLIASTLPLSNADFLAGRFSGTAGPVAEGVRNQGAITTPAGGKVWLIAPEVENSGIITAPEGDVLLAAGRSVHLVDSTTPDIAVVVSAPGNKALNLGRIVAQSGKVGIYGGLVSQKGVVNADSAVVGKDGRIFFKSTHGTTLDAASVTTASGGRGDITVSATEGNTLVSGTMAATGAESTGGNIKVLGVGVALLNGAQLDASGASGGGSLLVGGDYQGKNPAVQNAQTTYVGKDVLLRADALTNGEGGKIIVWSDASTRAYGTLSARGGSLGGNGGLIETSGHFLDVAGSRIDAAAPRGMAGTWLLDPLDIEIAGTSMNVDTLPDTPTPGTLTIQPNALGTPSQIFASSISSSLEAGTNVIITTSVAGGSAGNITVNAPITKTGASPAATLLLDAVGDIILNQPITNSSSTPLDVTLTAGGGVTSAGGGAVNLSYGTLTANAGSGITLNGTVPTFNATNGATGGITFTNGGALTVNNVTQNSSTPVVITSNGNLLLGSINAAGGGVVTLRANNGAITDYNSSAVNVSGAYRLDFNDGTTATPGSVGDALDAIEVANLGAGGVTAQAGSGGIYIDNTAGSLKLGGISYNGTSGDVVITSSTDTIITGGLGSLSGHTGSIAVEVANAPLTINAPVNKGGTGSLLLRATGATGDVIVSSNILGNGNGVSIEAGRDLTFTGSTFLNGASLDLASVAGNILASLAEISTPGNTTLSAIASGTISLANTNNSLSGPITVSGGNTVSITNSGNLNIGQTTQAGMLTLQSMSGSIFGASTLGGTQVNATAATGINLTGANTPVTVNLANGASGDVFYSSSVGNAMTLAVTGSNAAPGGTFGVSEATGDLRVNPAGISTANGGIILTAQKPSGTLTIAGPVNAGTGTVEISGFNVLLQGDLFGDTVRLKAYGAGSGLLSASGAPRVAAASFIDLLADNMSLNGGQFGFSNTNLGNRISLRSVSDNRPVTIGAACTIPGCLLLTDLADTLFSTPQLVIGNDTIADPNTAGNIDISSPFNRPGMISLRSGGSITQSAGATIGVNSLAVSGTSVDLRQSNPVGVVAGRASTGDFLYRSQNLLTLSDVDMLSGISAKASVWLESDSSSGINQNMGSRVTASTLVLNTIGPVNLMDGGNSVSTLAADLFRSGTGGGGLQFSNGSNPLIINTGLGISGIRTNNQSIMLMAGGTPANGLAVRTSVDGGNSFVNLSAPSILLDSGSSIVGGSVRLIAFEPTGSGTISAMGATVPVVQALKGIELETDNLAFSVNPVFTVSTTDIRNEINIMPHTAGRPITVGTACAMGPCLLLNNVSSSLFNAPTLVIGSENILPTTATKPPPVAGDISIASAITRTGRLALLTGGTISQTAPITADGMGIVAAGEVTLTGANSVNKLAALAKGPLSFTTSGALDIVTVVGGIEDPATIEGVNALGNITLTSGGTITLNSPVDAGIQTVTLNTGGALLDVADRSLYPASIYAGTLRLSAASGIGTVTAPLVTSVTSISATAGTGDIAIGNSGAVTIGVFATDTAGSIWFDNKGKVTTGTSAIQAPGGNVTVIAHSPLSIGTGGVSASGNILLEAAASGGGDNMVVAGNILSSNGSIALRAGNTVTITGSVSAPNGTAKKTEELNTPPGFETDLQPPPPPPPPGPEPPLPPPGPEPPPPPPEVTEIPSLIVSDAPYAQPPLLVPDASIVETPPPNDGTQSVAVSIGNPQEPEVKLPDKTPTEPPTDVETTTSEESESTKNSAAESGTGSSTKKDDSAEGKDDKKKEPKKKPENAQKDGEKKDAPKKKQYCN